jgi:hypothetical protein
MTIQGPSAVAAPAIEENPPGGPRHNVPLGTLVRRADLMPLENITDALRAAVKSGRRLGEVLLERGLEERALVRLLAAQNAQPFVDVAIFPIDYDVIRMLPQAVARTYCAVPIARDEGKVIVAVPDAGDARQVDRLREALKCPVRLVTAARSDIKEAIERLSPTGLAPPAAPPRPETYDVALTLVSGATVVVDCVTSRPSADALAERLASEARVGATITMRDGTVDGADVVSVEIYPGGSVS